MKLKVAAKAILVNSGKVLIMSDAGKWDFPGGGIEGDEGLTDALKREILEETGFSDFTIGKVVHADEWFIEKLDLHVVGIFYRCEIGSQQTPTLSDEHTEFAWVTPQELANYDVTEDTIRALEAVTI